MIKLRNIIVRTSIIGLTTCVSVGAYAQVSQAITKTTTTNTQSTTQQQAVMPVAQPPATPLPPPVVLPETTRNNQFQEWIRLNTQNTQTQAVATKPAQQAKPVVIQGHKPLSFEEGQQEMLEMAPPSNIPQDPDAQYAFNNMLQQNMPMSPRQVVQLRQQIDLSQRAAAVQPNIPAKPVSSTIMVNLAPGVTPPVIRLAQGYVSSLVFVDSSGAPWPIAAFDIGNPKSHNIQWDGKSNILLIQAVSPYSDGNMVVRLVGLPTPVTLELVSGQRVVDFRVDIHVSGIGPNTKDIPIASYLPNPASNLLLSVLDGVAPPGSRALNVLGADAQAWLLGDHIFLRTRLTVLSPGWIGTMKSPDGMNAYELPRSSTILVSRYGEPAELRIEGF